MTQQYEFDITKPNAGRMYDYFLGGAHNFPADRAAADRILAIMPSITKWARLNRWFLLRTMDQLAEEHFAGYIDLATGLPTQGYIHEKLPETTRIIYNDIDPVTVQFARHLIGNRPNIRYIGADLRNIEVILDQAMEFFGNQQPIGFVMVGVAYFVDDEALHRVLKTVYDWVAPGSKLAITFATQGERLGPTAEGVLDAYKKINATVYLRTRKKIDEIMPPWVPVAPGFLPLEQAIGLEGVIAEREDPDSEMIGGIFVKPAA